MTSYLTGIDVVVFDVLGTLVDQPAGLRRAFADVAPTADPPLIAGLVDRWQHHVDSQQSAIARGQRPYVSSEVLDAEAADVVRRDLSNWARAKRTPAVDTDAAADLAFVSRRLPPWPDSVAELDRLGARLPVLALSNSEQRSLFHLSANSGMRWHAAVSADDVDAYKPAPQLYERAIEVADRPADRVLMVAAHAWDLRAAQRAGMRTCYVARPVGDPPREDDHFDVAVSGLGELLR